MSGELWAEHTQRLRCACGATVIGRWNKMLGAYVVPSHKSLTTGLFCLESKMFDGPAPEEVDPRPLIEVLSDAPGGPPRWLQRAGRGVTDDIHLVYNPPQRFVVDPDEGGDYDGDWLNIMFFLYSAITWSNPL